MRDLIRHPGCFPGLWRSPEWHWFRYLFAGVILNHPIFCGKPSDFLWIFNEWIPLSYLCLGAFVAEAITSKFLFWSGWSSQTQETLIWRLSILRLSISFHSTVLLFHCVKVDRDYVLFLLMTGANGFPAIRFRPWTASDTRRYLENIIE